MILRRAILVFTSILVGCSGADEMLPEISGELIQQHMRTLSGDEYQGRSPGTPGGDAAADYVAQAFAGIGLEPVAGSYYQTVPMIGSTPDPTSVSLSFVPGEVVGRPPEAGDGEEVYEAEYLDEFVLWSGDAEARSIAGRGELVFVGYGIDSPENNWDDYGVDVNGKFVLILVNDPPAPRSESDLFGGPAMTYYGRWTYKYEEAARQGAQGALIIHTTDAAGYGWNVVRGGWSGEQFALPADPNSPSPAAFKGWLSFSAAADVLALGGYNLDEMVDQAQDRSFRPISTGIDVNASVRSRVRRVETKNVVGLLPGADRGDEIITITSHYDHLGVGEPVDDDAIYNGAYDNASGTGMLIAMAEAFTRVEQPISRSILFIATAAEEQGLLGGEWYTQSPLFPLAQTVAEINVDGANLWGETNDIIVQGEERSELGAFARLRAAEMGLTLRPDAEPEKGFFFRSDHFPFARAGVPSLYFEHGRDFRGKPDGWGEQLMADYTASRYHGPKDEYLDEFVFDGAVQQANLVFLTALDIARGDSWPNWNADSEFRANRDAMRPGG
jgi:Zn-dependent M28 family amino/carboxypeptidase